MSFEQILNFIDKNSERGKNRVCKSLGSVMCMPWKFDLVDIGNVRVVDISLLMVKLAGALSSSSLRNNYKSRNRLAKSKELCTNRSSILYTSNQLADITTK